jgi:hypothetical protein
LLHSFGFTLPRFEVAATSALIFLLSLVLLSQRPLKADFGGARANGWGSEGRARLRVVKANLREKNISTERYRLALGNMDDVQ